jgi:uncharacterized protein (TIGR02117 family)
VKRFVVAVLALAAGAPCVYGLLALVLGLVSVNRDFAPAREDKGGVAIYIRTNGVHAEFVLPARAAGGHDWTREFPPLAIVDVRRVPSLPALAWIAFGWGDRAFYLETPTWRDLRAKTALGALSGRGSGAMHIEYLARPEHYRALRVVIDEDQYARLVAHVRAGFVRDAQGGAVRIDHPGYFATDAFFEGTGRYSLRLTSNEWVRRGLADAGIRTALWSPFDVALFWHLER